MVNQEETLFFTGRNLLVLYLLLSGPLLDSILPCHAKRLINSSVILRHVLGYLTLLFFVVIIDEFTDSIKSVTKILGICAVIYIWFVISSKMTGSLWLALLAVLAAMSAIELYTSRIDKPSDELEEWTSLANTVLIVLAVAITLIGFLGYRGEKKLEYGGSFSYFTFLLGKEGCSGTVSSAPFMKSLRAAFI